MKGYILLAACSILLCPLLLSSQQPLVGTIQGKVNVPYATLTLTNIDSVEPESSRRTTGADQHGLYEFVEVPPGRFSILVRKSGYRDYTIPMVTVHEGQTVDVPEIKMSPATTR